MLNSLNGSASAFTLIELLTVSSIVAVLAALLFPAFTSAMESNRQTKCLSNLKQIGAAVMLYAGENDGSFPNAVRGPEDNPGTHSAIWQTDLAKYVGAAAKGSRPFGPPARETVWNCPAAEPNRELVGIRAGLRSEPQRVHAECLGLLPARAPTCFGELPEPVPHGRRCL